jgi:hypothetical protein
MNSPNTIASALDTPSMSKSGFNNVQITAIENTGGLRLAITTFAEAEKFATLMSLSNFVPKHLRGKPADCLAVLLQSMRWEMDPFTVAQKTYFVNDGIGYEAQLIAAVILSRAPITGRPDIEWSGTGDALKCIVSATFKGETKPKTREVETKTITTKNSPLWKQDPQQQLAYYTLRAWARLHCPDIILGVYTREEREEMIDITPPPSAAKAIEEELKKEAGQTVPQPHDPVTGEVIDQKATDSSPPSLQDWLDDIANAPTAEGVDHKYGQAAEQFLKDHSAMAALTLAKTQRKQALAKPKVEPKEGEIGSSTRKLFQGGKTTEGAAA